MMNDLVVLQSLRLKGRATPEQVATSTGLPADAVELTLAALTEAGLAVAGKLARPTPEGRDRLAELLAAERATADAQVIADRYEAFRGVNADFKALVTDWQLRDGQPNDHTDADYDRQVLVRLDDVHARVVPIVAAVADTLPRLSRYVERLDNAHAAVTGGDHSWLTRPIIDSYHTVWFELHEELIVAAGLTREDEARAGHAQ